MGGNVPNNYILAVGLRALALGEGLGDILSGNPISCVRMVFQDGASHAVDSLELGF